MSLFSGKNWLPMKVAPPGSLMTVIRGPWRVERRDHHLTAQLRGLRGRRAQARTATLTLGATRPTA